MASGHGGRVGLRDAELAALADEQPHARAGDGADANGCVDEPGATMSRPVLVAVDDRLAYITLVRRAADGTHVVRVWCVNGDRVGELCALLGEPEADAPLDDTVAAVPPERVRSARSRRPITTEGVR